MYFFLFSFYLVNQKRSAYTVLSCNNNETKNKDKIVFSLPTTPDIKKAWLSPINCKEGNLSHKITVCSDHFEEKCFDHL